MIIIVKSIVVDDNLQQRVSFWKETTVNIVTLLMKRLRDMTLKSLKTHNYEELLTFARLSLN